MGLWPHSAFRESQTRQFPSLFPFVCQETGCRMLALVCGVCSKENTFFFDSCSYRPLGKCVTELEVFMFFEGGGGWERKITDQARVWSSWFEQCPEIMLWYLYYLLPHSTCSTSHFIGLFLISCAKQHSYSFFLQHLGFSGHHLIQNFQFKFSCSR